MRPGRCRWLVAALGAALVGCVELSGIDEERARSWGACNRGMVVHPAALPFEGDGYWVPPLWRARGHEYGADGLIDLVVGVARRIELADGPRLGVGDMSPPAGGSSSEHRSHQAGRDVDLLYFLTAVDGTPHENDAMRRVGGDGLTVAEAGAPRYRFDVARNWQLVRALLTAPEAEVQYIFLYEPLSQRLLDHARERGEPEVLIARARAVLHQPSDSAKHDDHMHVRIYCSAEDRAVGCVDRGPPAADVPLEADDTAAIARAALRALPPAWFAGH